MIHDPLKRRLFSTVAAGALAMSAGSGVQAQVSDAFDPVRALAGATGSTSVPAVVAPVSAPADTKTEPSLIDRDRLEMFEDRFTNAPVPSEGKAAGIASNTQSAPEVVRLLNEAKQLNAAKKHAEALASIEKALTLEPENLRLLEERSLAYNGLERYAEALADNDRLIVAEPRRVPHKVMRFKYLVKLNRVPDAFQLAEALVKAEPQFVFAYYMRAYVLVEMGRQADAMTDLNLALEKDGNLAPALVLRAALNLKKASHDAVIADASKVLIRFPKDIDALVFRGQSYIAKEQFDLAIVDFQAALALNSNLTAAKRGLEVAVARQESAKKSPPPPTPPPISAPVAPASQMPMPPPIVTPATLTKPAPPITPASTTPPAAPVQPAPAPVAPATTTAVIPVPATGVDEKFRAAVTDLLSKRMFKEAMASVDGELAKAPANPSLIHLRGAVFAAAGSFELAIAQYDRALKIDPQLRPALSDRALAALYMGQNQKAIDYAKEALAVYADAYEVLNYRGLAYLGMEKLDDALADFTSLTTGYPKFVLGWYNRGRVFAARKEHDKALSDFNQALQIDPRHALTLGQRGLIHLAKRDLKTAEADFKTALEINRTTGAAQKGMQAIQATRAMEQLGQIKKGG